MASASASSAVIRNYKNWRYMSSPCQPQYNLPLNKLVASYTGYATDEQNQRACTLHWYHRAIFGRNVPVEYVTRRLTVIMYEDGLSDKVGGLLNLRRSINKCRQRVISMYVRAVLWRLTGWMIRPICLMIWGISEFAMLPLGWFAPWVFGGVTGSWPRQKVEYEQH